MVASMIAVVGCSGGGSGTNAGDGTRVNGLGSTFMAPAMTMLTKEYNTAHNVQIDYIGKGSSAGVQQMTEKTVDFGGTDAPLSSKQLADVKTAGGGEVVHIPFVIGGVVAAYNLRVVDKPLNFTGPILADIYLGKIKKWNDKAIADANPGVTLPDLGIKPVYRSDGSGTSNIFTEYLSKVSPEFKEKIGSGTSPDFKGVGEGSRGNDGVSGVVKQTAGAICYTELAYAIQKKIKYGTVKNKAGKFVEATLDSVTAAADHALKVEQSAAPYSLHKLTYSLTDAGGETSYPISGIAYVVFYKDLAAAKKKVLVDFLRWATHEGQQKVKSLDYAPIPAELAKKIDDRLKEVE
jgi:phosphate transport system substrate-binding protein